MPARNDITGDAIISRKTDDKFRDGWDRIFNKTKDEVKEKENDQKIRDQTEGN